MGRGAFIATTMSLAAYVTTPCLATWPEDRQLDETSIPAVARGSVRTELERHCRSIGSEALVVALKATSPCATNE